ncbi:hypothetical protein VL10_12930 [Leclercia adecarboxylata]|nr:hypothetical protein VL10_12930 [Leclercia adecarboxylata]KMN66816.1 hypothetical protein VK95_04265 [Leclercia sp. LK8]
MRIIVGRSYFTAGINSDRINEMLPPLYDYMEKNKRLFFSTVRDTLICLYNLCNPTPDLTSREVEDLYFHLKALSPPYADKDFFRLAAY